MNRSRQGLASLILLVCATGWAAAADWQFSVPTDAKGARAFLWIPPTCARVRGLIIGQQVILEKLMLEDPQVRAAAEREGLAEVFLVPAKIGAFDDHDKGGEVLQGILDRLAAASGYDEIAQAPFLTIGHSGGGIFAWNAGYWKPERTLGIIAIKCAAIHPPATAPKASVDGIPVLDISGQYESWGVSGHPADWHWKWLRGSLLEFRAIGTASLVSELVEPGAGHFGWYDELAGYVAMFIRKAAHARLPVEGADGAGAPLLRTVPLHSGWLTDCTFLTAPRYQTAAYDAYTGDPALAMWHLDEELARANDAFGAQHKGKDLQLVSFVQDGAILPSAWIEELRFAPLPGGDGMTMRVAADFVTETPPELSYPTKLSLSHAAGPIRFRLIGGWRGGGEQVGPDTFRIRFDRFGIHTPSDALMVMAFHPGDSQHSYHEQAAVVKFPIRNTTGTEQVITMESIPDQDEGAAPLTLHAAASARLPVEFCVLSGPAELRSGVLTQTAIPPRAKRPLTVTVVAYQWGRMADPAVRTAGPVEVSFQIGAPGAKAAAGAAP